MSHSRKRHRKTATLTDRGLQKLEAAKLKVQFNNNYDRACTLEALSEITGLSTHTLSKIHSRQVPVDVRTLIRYFHAFDLTLEIGDYRHSPAPKNSGAGRALQTENWLSLNAQNIAESSQQTESSWGQAPTFYNFCDRVEEIETLTGWITEHRCRLIQIAGIGGIGKTALALVTAHRVKEQFEFVIWRSLRQAPALETLLTDLVTFLSRQQDREPKPERLLYWLQKHRCLLILDNQDTLMQSGGLAGKYQSEFSNYAELFRTLAEANHQSCILLTSREKSSEVAILENKSGPVRSLLLKGSPSVSLSIVESAQLIGTAEEKMQLCNLYGCNPLAVKMIVSSIENLFDGNIAAFLQQESLIFNSLRQLLAGQFARLSPLEQTIMYWLAVNQKWMSIAELQLNIIPAISGADFLEAIESLIWRCLIEKRAGEYTLPPLIMEYVTEGLIERMSDEIADLPITGLNHRALLNYNHSLERS